MNLKSSSCDLAPFPVFIINCQFSNKIINLSMESGILSTDLKVASVKLWHC